MRQIGIALLTALLVLAHPPVRVSAQTAAFRGAIRNSRSDIDARNGHLLGPGAVKVRDAVSHACYIFLGEDHGIAEVPEFAEALTRELVVDEIHTLALEVSPSVAGQLSAQLASANPRQTFAAFLRQNQLTVPFYNTVEEFEFLQHAKSRIGTSQETWSLFDLRALRGSSEASPDLQRFVYGYDFLVVVPHPTASHEIQDGN